MRTRRQLLGLTLITLIVAAGISLLFAFEEVYQRAGELDRDLAQYRAGHLEATVPATVPSPGPDTPSVLRAGERIVTATRIDDSCRAIISDQPGHLQLRRLDPPAPCTADTAHHTYVE